MGTATPRGRAEVGLSVAGIPERSAVQELVDAGLVRLEEDTRPEDPGFHGRIWAT